MNVLVCGGRGFVNEALLYTRLDDLHRACPITVIIHGDAFGADRLAQCWAEKRGIEVAAFPADWDRYGRAAGPIRNRQMLEQGKPALVVAFPGGKGTWDMIDQADRAGIEVNQIV